MVNLNINVLGTLEVIFFVPSKIECNKLGDVPVTESAIRIPINQLYEAEQPIKDP